GAGVLRPGDDGDRILRSRRSLTCDEREHAECENESLPRTQWDHAATAGVSVFWSRGLMAAGRCTASPPHRSANHAGGTTASGPILRGNGSGAGARAQAEGDVLRGFDLRRPAFVERPDEVDRADVLLHPHEIFECR